MFQLPTLRAPGSPAKERKQSPVSIASSNLLKRRSLSVFSRRQASVSTICSDSTAVDSDYAWSAAPSRTASIAGIDSLKHGTSNNLDRRPSTAVKPKSIPIITPYDSLNCLMISPPKDQIVSTINITPPTSASIITSSIEESDSESFSLPVEPVISQSRLSLDKPKIQIDIPRDSSAPPLFLHDGALAPNNSPSRLFISDSPVPSGPSSSRHKREASTSTVGSIYSVYDNDGETDEASQRSSVSSVGSDFGKLALQNDVQYSPVRHQSQEYEDFLALQEQQDKSVGDIVDLLRTESTKRAACVSRQSCVDDSILRRLDEDETAEFTPSAESEVDLQVVIALQIQKQQSRKQSSTFAHLRQPPVPPRSERRRSPVMSIPGISPQPSPTTSSFAASKSSTALSRSAVLSALGIIEEAQPHAIFANQRILECIMTNASEMQDLFNLALSNKAFYDNFKKQELPLMQSVLKTMSPAGWEFKQMLCHDEGEDADSAAPVPDFTAQTFYRSYMRDYNIIASLKRKIHDRCRSTVRIGTERTLLRNTAHRKSSVNDALWRIWTFSKIFGGGKDREDDISTQLDWLRGGIIAHTMTATSSVLACDSWYATSALLAASDHFAAGNCGGLGADELYDMIEMWDSLRTITDSLVGQVELARVYGVFTGRASNQDCTEDAMLEEWHNYILTCGLPIINQIANAETSLSAFQLARVARYDIWASISTATISSRAVFLREPVNKLYEERILESFSNNNAESKQSPLVRRNKKSPTPDKGTEFGTEPSSPISQASSAFSDEVMMSRANTVLDRLSTKLSNGAYPAPLRLSISIPPEESLGIHPAFRSKSLSVAANSSSSGTSLARSSICMSSASSYASSSSSSSAPITPPPAAVQHPFQLALVSPDPSTTSSDRAIFRIVEMGFTADQAQAALKITDQGEGLCVDRAVEYLLRQ